MKKHSITFLLILSILVFTGCSNGDTSGTQARTDLTSSHIRGLYSGMDRNDIEDLLGSGDKSLASHENIDVYSLSDGTTAILRYRDDQLIDAYIRDQNNNESSIFNNQNSNNSNSTSINETSTTK